MKDLVSPAVKDLGSEHPVAVAWRRTFHSIVEAFAEGDFTLSRGVSHVRPVDADTAQQMRAYIADYGATLVALPDDTWNTSLAQWYGVFWEVLVDLWTAEEGRSDLVLDARVYEAADDFEVQIHLIYVP
ncbi:MAG TPA: hypothetical protein VE010_17805 [Thermoanaerobaculia bacterium]|nr:hypothetical protein [Thermoanaerobaculia bacterium]